MFTGLVQDTARVLTFEKDLASECWNLWVETRLKTADWNVGDSVANNGVCLTVVALDGPKVLFQVGPETLKVSNLAEVAPGDGVHLETSLRMGDPLGGHWVSGHVDGTGVILRSQPGHEVLTLTLRVENTASKHVAPYLVPKGSIAMDGVSLTVNAVRDTSQGTEFDVTLIPHTLKLTRFAELSPGDRLNLEADLMAKHAARYAEYWKGNTL
jgi:riboflavin synthase